MRVTLVSADGQVIASAASSARDDAGGMILFGRELWDQITGLVTTLPPGNIPVAGGGRPTSAQRADAFG